MEHMPEVIARLIERVSELEDREQIARLISAYGPAVDAGSPEATVALWTEDGSYAYEIGGEPVVLQGRDAVAGMVAGDLHQSIIRGGAGHVLSNPFITVTGDRATATNHSMLVRHEPESGRYYVDRLTANRWLLRRTPEGWRVVERSNRLLDGDARARALLGEGGVGPDPTGR